MQQIMTGLLKRKWWILTLIVVVAGGFYGYRNYSTSSKVAPTGQSHKVSMGNVVAVVSATGTISPVNSVDVSSKINGRIIEVRVNENDMVKANQIIILLDDRSIQAQVEQSKAKRENALANLNRTEVLAAAGALAKQQLDADRTTYRVADAAYDDIVSGLEDTIIRAPIDGMVIGKPIPAGQTVAPGISNPMVLLTVVDMATMQIQALVDESDIGKVKVGQKVLFTVDAYPAKKFSGLVSVISSKANLQQNVVYYTVYINVDSPEGLLKPTMTARVSVNVDERNNVVVIPISGIKDTKGQRFVQKIGADGVAQPVQITTGLGNDQQIEVLSGLSPGDMILLPQGKTASSAAAGAAGGMNIFRAPGR